MLPGELVIVAILGLGAACGALAAGGELRRAAATASSIAALGLPFAIRGGSAMLRVLAALFAIAVVIKVSDLVRDRPARAWPLRLAHTFTIHDLRLARFGEPAVQWRSGAVGVALGALAVGAVVAAVEWEPSTLPEAWGRWTLSLVATWIGAEALDRVLSAGWGLVGVELAPVQNAPIRSRTVAEFWGRRWNAVVRDWLATMAFRPAARGGWVRGASFASFLLSAAIHAYIALPALPWPYVAAMAGFFLVHACIVELERRVAVRRWAPPAAHVWTAAWFLATGPLFLEPVLAAFGSPTHLG